MARKRKGPDADDPKPDRFEKPGPGNDLEIPGCIGDAVAFVSNGQDIRIQISAGTYQFHKLIKSLLSEAAAEQGKSHRYQKLIDELDDLLLKPDFRVRAYVWLGRRDLNVSLGAESGEIVPTGWADPRRETDTDHQ